MVSKGRRKDLVLHKLRKLHPPNVHFINGTIFSDYDHTC